MSFTESVRTCFSKYFDFSGRALRSEYWWWILFLFVAGFCLGLVEAIFFPSSVDDTQVLNSLFSLATLVPTFAVTARRLHDRDLSGWWQLAPYGMVIVASVMILIQAFILAYAAGIAAIVLVIALFVWLIMVGTNGPNRFGPDPLG